MPTVGSTTTANPTRKVRPSRRDARGVEVATPADVVDDVVGDVVGDVVDEVRRRRQPTRDRTEVRTPTSSTVAMPRT
jgi:hypothetical protein